MKNNFLISILLLIFCLTNAASIAQKSIIVQIRDGSESGVQLELLQIITFNAGFLQLRNTSDIIRSYSVDDIQKISFGIYSSVISPDHEGNLQVFPNPVSDYFTIKNAPPEKYIASIFSIDGRIIKEVIVNEENQQINVEELQSGIYLLRINKSTIKFSKL